MRSRHEERLQIAVAEMLGWLLPPEIPWTSVDPAGRGQFQGARMKERGVRRGWPDIQLLHKRRYVGLELKSPKGVLSPAQRELHERIVAAGGVVAVCRSVQEVKDFLDLLGVPTREHKPSQERIIAAGERIGGEAA